MFIRNFLFTAQNFTCKIKRLVTLTHPLMTQMPAASLRPLCILFTICYNILIFFVGEILIVSLSK